MSQMFRAIEFAARKHIKQFRKGNAGPYISHPMGVMWILTRCGIRNENTLIAAVLHDTVEDTDTTLEEIEELFGKIVAEYVAEVSDDKSLPKAKRKRLQVEHAKHASIAAKMIKLADKYHNLESLIKDPPKGWDVERIQGYFVWAEAVVQAARGCNPLLEEMLDFLINGYFGFEGKEYPCIPYSCSTPEGKKEFLEKYYKSMENAEE
jgi:(p)ppGpp synthase/HD superfamily hydrolase